VPICFVIVRERLYTPLDDKPKASRDPLALARVRDIRARPEVTVLVDRWSEDWSKLAWVRLEGRATVTESTPEIVAALRAKYPQYADHDLESRPMIRVSIERVATWGV
jgi:PPOX class probable F420-dependent enzyme